MYEAKYAAKQSVIEENISDANLLNSMDDQMHKSIRIDDFYKRGDHPNIKGDQSSGSRT